MTTEALKPGVQAAIDLILDKYSKNTLTLDFVRQISNSLSAQGSISADVFVFYSGQYLGGTSAQQAALDLAAQ